MNLLFDTNIIVAIVRAEKTDELIEFLNPHDKNVYSTVVVEAEIKSIAVRNNWGSPKLAKLDYYLSQFAFTEITKPFINTYVQIDTFSQKQNPNFKDYTFDTPRNMGKNDLWIASTATILGLELVTTDADFAHLHNVFLDVRQIELGELKKYF
jgi:tRNA(fMet)-specific endonuclease VapC